MICRIHNLTSLNGLSGNISSLLHIQFPWPDCFVFLAQDLVCNVIELLVSLESPCGSGACLKQKSRSLLMRPLDHYIII